jgi:hypothetical protein
VLTVTTPVTGATYRKNTSAPSSKQELAFEVVAHSETNGVKPSVKGSASSTLSLTGGMQGVPVPPDDDVTVAAVVVGPTVPVTVVPVAALEEDVTGGKVAELVD